MNYFPMKPTLFLRILAGLLFCLPVFTLPAQSPIPNFTFLTLSDQPFTQAQIDLTQPALIVHFDPYCDHCEQQAEWIAEASASFRTRQLIFVSLLDEPAAIEEFQTRYFGEGEWPQLHFLRDPEYRFEQFFGYTDDALNIYAYRPGEKRLKYFGKEQPAEVLLKYL